MPKKYTHISIALQHTESIYQCRHMEERSIDIKYHFTCELVEDKTKKIELVYCASEDMVADMLTIELYTLSSSSN